MAVMDSVKEAYRFTFAHYKAYVSMALPLAAVYALLDAAQVLMPAMIGTEGFIAMVAPLGLLIVKAHVIGLVMINWHRAVLEGLPLRAQARLLVPLQDSERKFIGLLILFNLGFWLLEVVNAVHPSFLWMLIGVALVYVCLRLSYYFPALAIGAPITAALSWALARGQVLRIFLGTFLASLAPMGLAVVWGAGVGIYVGLHEKMHGSDASFRMIENFILNAPLSLMVILLVLPLSTATVALLYRARVIEAGALQRGQL